MARKRKTEAQKLALGGTKNLFEKSILDNCNYGNITYETETIPYEVQEIHNYIPDFVITRLDGSKVYVEAKGYLRPSHIKKMLLVRRQHPELDIRFVFQRNNKMPGARKLTYGEWAEKNGFNGWAIGLIPAEWCR